MKDIYILSIILALLVVLPIIILTIKSCFKINKSRTVLVTVYNADEICDDVILDIKAVWYEEHFCSSANGRPIVLAVKNADENVVKDIKNKLDNIDVVLIENLLEYLENEGQK